MGGDLPQQTGSTCLHSIILEPRGSCGRTHTVNAGLQHVPGLCADFLSPPSKAGQAQRTGPILAIDMGPNKSSGYRRVLSEDKGVEGTRLGPTHHLGTCVQSIKRQRGTCLPVLQWTWGSGWTGSQLVRCWADRDQPRGQAVGKDRPDLAGTGLTRPRVRAEGGRPLTRM